MAPAIRWIVEEVPPGVPGRLVGKAAAVTRASAQPASNTRMVATPAAPRRLRAMAIPASASAPAVEANSGSPSGEVTA